MASHHPIRKTVSPPARIIAPVIPPVIPDKLYFRIGDVAKLCGVPAYVLRFWETEFPNLKPNKGGTGQRLYRRKDVETALRIKSLLYQQGYTIPGARQIFKSENTRPDTRPDARPDARPDTSTGTSTATSSPELTVLPTAAQRSPETTTTTTTLHSLREDLRSLAAQLSEPVAATQPRPQLRLEPKPKPAPRPELVPARPAISLNQGDLFPSE